MRLVIQSQVAQRIIAIIMILMFFAVGLTLPHSSAAFGECDEYGFMATYDILADSCKCMSGYVFGKDFLGNTQCVSGDSVCSDKYGVMSRYNSLDKSCECTYGYILAEQYGKVECVLGDQLCRSKHGSNSSYEDLSGSCKCDSGYTLNDDGQCVEKQNNVYFRLLDVDTDNKLAIVKSEYDSRKYLIEYAYGCYSNSIQRYLGYNLVVNLGTDFDVDRWDKIVLQDDNEICDIRSEERTYYDSFEEMRQDQESDEIVDFISLPSSNYIPVADRNKVIEPILPATKWEPVLNNDFDVSDSDISPLNQDGVISDSASFRKCPSKNCSIIRYYAEGSRIRIVGSYLKDDWYQIQGSTDAGGGGSPVVGWIHKSLINSAETSTEPESTITSPVVTSENETQVEEEQGLVARIWKSILGWFF